MLVAQPLEVNQLSERQRRDLVDGSTECRLWPLRADAAAGQPCACLRRGQTLESGAGARACVVSKRARRRHHATCTLEPNFSSASPRGVRCSWRACFSRSSGGGKPVYTSVSTPFHATKKETGRREQAHLARIISCKSASASTCGGAASFTLSHDHGTTRCADARASQRPEGGGMTVSSSAVHVGAGL